MYICYFDYADSKEGKEMLVRYDIANNKKYSLQPIGVLVGVTDE
ncbi:MAG: hypothetical protein WBZ48_10265 [Bacteroidota bacterium]